MQSLSRSFSEVVKPQESGQRYNALLWHKDTQNTTIWSNFLDQ